MNALGRWRRLEPARRILLLRAVAALCAASLEVRLRPFPRIAARFGALQPPRSDPAGDGVRAQDVRWAVSAAARRLPFECACLARAVAAHGLCRAHGLAPVLHMGAERGQYERAETHAWLTAAGVGVTGYPLPPGMVEVGCFCA